MLTAAMTTTMIAQIQIFLYHGLAPGAPSGVVMASVWPNPVRSSRVNRELAHVETGDRESSLGRAPQPLCTRVTIEALEQPINCRRLPAR